MTSLPNYCCEVLIIGSGAAGLSLALRLAPYYKIIVLSKKKINDSSTFYAQGGIAAVFDKNDSIESHIKDTLIAGAGLCDKNTVKFIASNARHCVQWLIDKGVIFDKERDDTGKQKYHLTREGGHSYRRILHCADNTGRVVENILVNQALKNANIHILEYCNAIDLIISDKLGNYGKRKVIGAWIRNSNQSEIKTCHAQVIVLATGGAATVYQYTTNPDIVSGDGIAMAWRAGCRVANLEFNQFHPTCLHTPQTEKFLLTEALRGEGAWLLRPDGTRFMQNFDPRAEMAPRDIVTRAIDHEMKRLGNDCMYLDISHKSKKFICNHFPSIYTKLLNYGLDLTKQPIPIVPAAHYTCGGVVVDHHGRTDIESLYAIGEVSYTGLHGANRMASNSLLECLVYAWSASKDIISNFEKVTNNITTLPDWDDIHPSKDNNENILFQYKINQLKSFMWNYMGIIRTTKQLTYIMNYINLLNQSVDEYFSQFYLSNNLLELRNLTQVSKLMVRCALERKETRGLHYISDFPVSLDIAIPTILIPRSSM